MPVGFVSRRFYLPMPVPSAPESSAENALVTVVVPVWDAYVECLRSSLASIDSAGAPAEVIVIDNASSTPLPDLDGRVQMVRSSRRVSRGEARNLGLQAVRTPYVVFLDADDVFVEGAFDTMLAQARRRPDAVAWACGIIDGSTGQVYRLPRRSARALVRFPTAFGIANAAWSLLTTQGATLLRSDVVRTLGGYGDADHGEDWEFGAHLGFAGRIVMSQEPVLVYHWHAASPGASRVDTRVISASAARVRARLRAAPELRRPKPVLALVWVLQKFALYGLRPMVSMVRIKPPWARGSHDGS